jgi:hypothetical protein
MTLAHIAGLPVEETLLALVPVGACGVCAFAYSARSWLRNHWRSASASDI